MDAAPGDRSLWVDVAKAGGIYLVVASHLEPGAFAESFLWTFHVPLFFFLSGYLHKPRPDRAFLATLARKLALPYVLSYIIITAGTALLHRQWDPATLLRTLAGIAYGTRSYPYFVNAALWFLPGLMLVEAVYTLGIRRWPVLYGACVAASFLLYRHHAENLFLSIDLALLGLNFFVAGAIARRLGANRYLEADRRRAFAGAVGGLACTVAAAAAGNVWYGGEHYLVSLGAALAGILMIACASIALAPALARHGRIRASVEFVSRNTLFILCFHVFSCPAAEALAARVELVAPPPLRAALLAIVAIALLVPFNWLAIRFVPALVGLPGRPPRSRAT